MEDELEVEAVLFGGLDDAIELRGVVEIVAAEALVGAGRARDHSMSQFHGAIQTRDQFSPLPPIIAN